jgi:hypothetical protein
MLVLFFLAVASVAPSPVFAQSDPPGGNIQAIAIDPHNSSAVYAGSEWGVFKSTDGGATWTAVNSGLPGPRASLYSKPIQVPGTSVLALVIDPSSTATIYSVVASAVAGVASLGRIFKSTNGGASWVSSNTGPGRMHPFSQWPLYSVHNRAEGYLCLFFGH